MANQGAISLNFEGYEFFTKKFFSFRKKENDGRVAPNFGDFEKCIETSSEIACNA